jgi:hypothetical protein
MELQRASSQVQSRQVVFTPPAQHSDLPTITEWFRMEEEEEASGKGKEGGAGRYGASAKRRMWRTSSEGSTAKAPQASSWLSFGRKNLFPI